MWVWFYWPDRCGLACYCTEACSFRVGHTVGLNQQLAEYTRALITPKTTKRAGPGTSKVDASAVKVFAAASAITRAIFCPKESHTVRGHLQIERLKA